MVLFNRRKYMRTRRSPQGAPIDIADATITVADSVQYTGTPRTPSVTVVYDGATLVVNQDYLVSYNDNTNLGAATAVITGAGEFAGQVVKTFQIVSAAPSVWDFKVEDMEYVGAAVTVAWQGARFFGIKESYSDSDALLVGGASLGNLFGFGQLIAKDSLNKIHVSNLNSSVETQSGASGEFFHLRLVSNDGKATFWGSNSTYTNYVKAVCDNAFDFQNLSFDTSNVKTCSILTQQPITMTFADEGKCIMYVMTTGDNGGNVIHLARLSTPYDFLTLDESSHTTIEITQVPRSYIVAIGGIVFNSSGTIVVISAYTSVYQFSLSTPYDLTTRTLVSQKTIDYELKGGIDIVNGGETLIGMTQNGKLHEYNLIP